MGHDLGDDSENIFDLAPRVYGVGHMAKRHWALDPTYSDCVHDVG